MSSEAICIIENLVCLWLQLLLSSFLLSPNKLLTESYSFFFSFPRGAYKKNETSIDFVCNLFPLSALVNVSLDSLYYKFSLLCRPSSTSRKISLLLHFSFPANFLLNFTC